MQKEDSIKYRGTQFNEKTNLLSDYIQLNLLAFQYLRNRNYNSAKKSFKECINIAKQFNEFDESKHLESLVNYAISQYFCGKFIDSFSSLERAYQISSRIITSIIKDKNTIKIESLNNFYEENIANNDIFNKDPNTKPEPNEINLIKNNNSNFNNEKLKKDLNELAEDEQLRKNISKTLLSLHKFLRENDIETWIRCLVEESTYFKGIKDVNGYVFTIINQYAANYYQTGKIGDFKNIYQTIINNYGERAKDKNKDKSPEKILMEMKSRIELAIDIYRKLVETENELFNLFNNKNSESGGKNKMIINAINLNNNIANTNKEKDIIIDDNKNQSNDDEIVFKNHDKDKNRTSKYQNNNINIYMKENENLEERNSNKFLIKLFFKHALYQLNRDTNINHKDQNLINEEDQTEKNHINDPGEESNNYMSSIKSQIELALKLLENDEFDVSSINIFNINSEVTKSLRILFENIKMIRNKKEMQKVFKNWKLRVLGYDKLSEHMKQKYIKNKAYFKSLLEEIERGDEITKIHYSSNGKIVHYYQIDSSTLTLKVYKNLLAKNTNSKFKSINLTDVKEILYGQSSENLLKRFKNLANKEFKEPWLFLSIILTKRSIDLYFDSQEKLNKWFYGFKYLIEEKKLNIKIKTTFDFVLTRTKLRLIKELREYNENNKGKQNKSIEVLNQLREYSLINLFGFDSLSVLKIILLYYKVMKVSV